MSQYMDNYKKQITIQSKIDTALNWQIANPILAEREIGYDKDTGQYKIGDGKTAWNNLPYALHTIESDLEITDQLNVGDMNNIIAPKSAAIGKEQYVGGKVFKIVTSPKLKFTDTQWTEAEPFYKGLTGAKLPTDKDGNIIPNLFYGYYIIKDNGKINTNSLVGKEYSVMIGRSFWCQGTIVAIESDEYSGRYRIHVSNMPHYKLEDGTYHALERDPDKDNEATGNIRNCLIIMDQPEIGDTTIGHHSVALGLMNKTYGRNTLAVGQQNTTLGQSSAAIGWQNRTGYMSFATGSNNDALGQYSVALGTLNTIDSEAQSAFAVGTNNEIHGLNGIALGRGHKVGPLADDSIVIGAENQVMGPNAFVGGYACTAWGRNSFAYGQGLSAQGKNTVQFGQYALKNLGDDDAIGGTPFYMFAIGNGEDKEKRSNSFTIGSDNNAFVNGSVYVGVNNTELEALRGNFERDDNGNILRDNDGNPIRIQALKVSEITSLESKRVATMSSIQELNQNIQNLLGIVLPIAGGTVTGKLTATPTDATSSQVRNISAGASSLIPGVSKLKTGDLYFVYET